MTQPFIITASGKAFDLFDPLPEQIDIADVAAHLAKANRFCGASSAPLSWAQHAVFVSERVSLAAAPHALLAGAHRAYLGDVGEATRAAMTQVDGTRAFNVLAQVIDRVIHRRFGLSWPVPVGAAREIAAADTLATATEARDLMPPVLFIGPGIAPKPAAGKIKPLPWPKAEEAFLERFGELFGASPNRQRQAPKLRSPAS